MCVWWWGGGGGGGIKINMYSTCRGEEDGTCLRENGSDLGDELLL